MILNVLIIHGIKVSSFDAVSAIKEINHSMQINIFKESDNTKVIDIIKNKDIHIIILDSDSNDLFHLNIVELLQNNIRTKNIHIMFLLDTFKAEDFLDNGYAIEEIDYLIKPIQKYQFLNKLHLYLKLLMCKRELDEYKKVIDYATIVSKTDTKGKITYVNDKFCRIYQY